ncbi:MAG: type IV pilus modification protein PilV [Steroidobacteraceae bacterium]
MSSQDSTQIVRGRERGFTLLEVMVALLVTAVGLLGIAKIQALAYASTGSASVRSLVAMQAGGLAASMHANRSYWAGGFAPIPVTITGPTVSGGTLGTEGLPIGQGYFSAAGLGYCQSGSGNEPCTAESMAASDLQTYATALNGLLNHSNPVTTITCPTVVSPTPVNCIIQITWSEKAVSISSQSVANTTQSTFTPTYTLYVEP